MNPGLISILVKYSLEKLVNEAKDNELIQQIKTG